MNVNFYVNEEKRTVVCKLSDTAEAVLDDLVQNGYMPSTPECYEDGLLKEGFTGKAKCSDEDTFDAEKGKRIAYKRAMAKYNRSKQKVVDRILRQQLKSFTNFSNTLDRLYKKYERIVVNSENDCKAIIDGQQRVKAHLDMGQVYAEHEEA